LGFRAVFRVLSPCFWDSIHESWYKPFSGIQL